VLEALAEKATRTKSAQGRPLAVLRRRSLARGLPRKRCVAIDFAVEDEAMVEEDAGALPYALVVSRVDSVDTHTINGITLELARLAGEYCGRYDGWECEVTRAEPVQ
jgi:hypothetical protein